MNLWPSVTLTTSLTHSWWVNGVANRWIDCPRPGSCVQVHLCPTAQLVLFSQYFFSADSRGTEEWRRACLWRVFPKCLFSEDHLSLQVAPFSLFQASRRAWASPRGQRWENSGLHEVWDHHEGRMPPGWPLENVSNVPTSELHSLLVSLCGTANSLISLCKFWTHHAVEGSAWAGNHET